MAKRDKETDSDDSSSSGSDQEWGKKNKKKGKRIKSIKEEEEREEGEVDDDDDDDDLNDDDIDEFNDGFDENLMGDEEDQKRLAEMTEKEREQELFNRSEKREVLRTRFEIERKLRLQKRRENALKDKPMIKNEFTEASLRSDERRRNIEAKKKQNSALQGLKEQREKKKQKAQILRAADVYSSSSSSDDDEDGGRKGSSSSSSSSSDESDDGKRHRSGRRSGSDDDQADNYEFTIADLQKIQVKRKDAEKWVHAPFFASTLANSFVKMGIGMSQSKHVYRICQVAEVVEKEIPYDLEKTKTNKFLKCRHSKDEKIFRISYLSNGDFLDTEFEEWKQRCLRDNVDFPNRSLVENKKRDIENARNYRYSDNDIASILKEKERFNKIPKNYAVEKTKLQKMKLEAEQNQNHELADQLQQELDQLEERAKELDKARTHSIAAISYINERNRLKNIAEAEKAILEAQDENKSDEADDPFRRRKCAPQLVHKVQKSKNPDGTPIKLEPKQEVGPEKESNGKTSDVVDGPSRGNPAVKIEVKQEKKSSMSPTRDDLFDAHNFDIQIDFDIGSSLPSVGNSSFTSSAASTPGPDVKPSTNRRSLNLDEYKRKKGLI